MWFYSGLNAPMKNSDTPIHTDGMTEIGLPLYLCIMFHLYFCRHFIIEGIAIFMHCYFPVRFYVDQNQQKNYKRRAISFYIIRSKQLIHRCLLSQRLWWLSLWSKMTQTWLIEWVLDWLIDWLIESNDWMDNVYGLIMNVCFHSG